MACALIIAGGIGNLIDRVFNNGYVIDYIHVKFFHLSSICRLLCFYWCSTVVYLCNFSVQIHFAKRIICEEKAKRKKK